MENLCLISNGDYKNWHIAPKNNYVTDTLADMYEK